MLVGQNIPLDTLKKELAPYGDCLLVVGNEKTAKVHIHSNHPGLVLECGLKYGSLRSVEINNMEEQNLEWKGTPTEEKQPLGIVAVGSGEGLNAILESLGASVVDGGPTMNPSAQDLATAIRSAKAELVLVLPNNSNILLAAEQAVKIAGRRAQVVPSVSIPQGIAALMAFNPYSSPEENIAKMMEAIKKVKTGEITRAARDSHLNGRKILEGDYLGLVEGRVVTCGSNLLEVLKQTLQEMIQDSSYLVTLYFGGELTTLEAESLTEAMREHFPEAEFELYYGGHPLYEFIISVE